MTKYRLEATAAVEMDVEAVFEWYRGADLALGFAFLEQVSSAYNRLIKNPFAYQIVVGEIRRSLMRKFPYAIYYSIENEIILVLAVIHTARDPEEWQYRLP